MVFSTIGPARGMKEPNLDRGPQYSSTSRQQKALARQNAKDESRKFSIKAQFQALVANGINPTNAAIQIGMRLPPAQIFSSNEILEFIEKDKYIGPQKRR
jgi:hypothetical protein